MFKYRYGDRTGFHNIALLPALKRFGKIKLPDAVIAATTLCQEAVLVTRNVRDFKGIAELKLENPFGDN
ncbi:hypothetical protein [Rivularia sp. UHCC 0363]|uniref:hypothetical protein n=1 Tax=Rivularia sp. UHCC 0363 TaxID=3110244 RepID=UPI002B1FA9F8|nr:hypothetical protein [Rivularia sp. UHCC 0363]MEA5593393.1 hypothetical protein [Rivularia sp. UHCC 0363]